MKEKVSQGEEAEFLPLFTHAHPITVDVNAMLMLIGPIQLVTMITERLDGCRPGNRDRNHV